MEKFNCIECSEEGGCPFAFYSELSAQIQNYACLPTPLEIINMRVHHGKTWACHENPDKPCLGAINYLKENNMPWKVIDDKLMTEKDRWDLCVEPLTDFNKEFNLLQVYLKYFIEVSVIRASINAFGTPYDKLGAIYNGQYAEIISFEQYKQAKNWL